MEEEDRALLVAFNAKFSQAVTDPAVVKKLLGSPHVRAWYKDYKAERASSLSLPDHWREVGLTPAQWAASQAARTAIREARADFATKSAELAAKFDADLKTAEKQCEARSAPHLTPLVRVLDAGYNQLPLEAQLRIESAAADRRTATMEAELKAWRVAALRMLADGQDPFRGL